MRPAVLLSALRLVLLATLVLGPVYLFAMTGVAQLLLPAQANGSLVRVHGQVVGSRLIGQAFTAPRFFQGRPSATTPAYNAAGSAASNLGPTNPALLQHVRAHLHQFLQENPGVRPGQVPPAMVESSASGIDPDIPVAGALLQVPRVARANGLPVALVRHLVLSHVRGRFLGIFGASYVNVLELNVALQRLARPASG